MNFTFTAARQEKARDSGIWEMVKTFSETENRQEREKAAWQCFSLITDGTVVHTEMQADIRYWSRKFLTDYLAVSCREIPVSQFSSLSIAD